jgi:preprotein translocase subunit SecA
MLQLARVLPLPGPVWGPYPIRPADDLAPPWRAANWRGGLAACRRVERAAAAPCARWQSMDPVAQSAALRELRATLRREGLTPALMARALGAVCATAQRTLGLQARASQLQAAAALLDNRMAEMATGEGKTLAIGLAAAVAALAGIPVHVVTANEYLATRDAAQLAPLHRALGLRSTALPGAGSDAAPAPRRCRVRAAMRRVARPTATTSSMPRRRRWPSTFCATGKTWPAYRGWNASRPIWGSAARWRF